MYYLLLIFSILIFLIVYLKVFLEDHLGSVKAKALKSEKVKASKLFKLPE